MDASPRHLAKYTAGYSALYPTARIVAITTTSIDAAFKTWSVNNSRIQPALSILLSLPPSSRVLLHSFSNGGAWTACLLAKRYRAKTGKALPLTAMLLDSSPGRATYAATVNAFAVALPKNILLYILGKAALHFFYWLYMFAYYIGGVVYGQKLDLIAQVRQDLNTKEYFAVGGRRSYVYSEGDEMVDWRFVEEHIVEARGLGYKVEGDRFGLESRHCGHLIADAGRYWGRVKDLWGKVC